MTIVATAFVAAGLFFMAVTAIGLLRLPGFFARVHAVSKSETIGIALLLIGLAIHDGVTLLSLKFVLAVIFVVIANPVAAHLLTRAAIRSGVLPWRRQSSSAEEAS